MDRRSFLAGCASLAGAAFSPSAATSDSPRVEADRWLEIDLYWFDKDDLESSVAQFWERYSPLFRGVSGWRGVILNVGWVMDYVLDWRGNPDLRIPRPQRMNQEHWFKVAGLLTGDTAERKRKWKERFASPIATPHTAYQDWTYADLRRVAALLREIARLKYGLDGMKVGSFVVGRPNIYRGEASPFSVNHKEVFLGGSTFNPEARLVADTTPYAAFPHGIAAGTPVTEFFGAQWGHLSRAVGLNAMVLRDNLLGPVPYRRYGPWGESLPADPGKWSSFSAATGALVKATKQANPLALVIGYSTAASAVGEWRVEGVDLETIAREGYLDAYIDQTWAGAWNEVGVREQQFWNTPYLGWTYQLANVLLHAVMLEGTKVRHLTLAETFDAWESWDVIHTAPERLQWGIWVYLHAAMKTPQGLKMPAGSYVSWANQGKRLLSPDDVALLSGTLNEATLDARQTQDVFGPTLVYNRQAMDWQSQNAPARSIKEWIDEQAAAVMKWSVPILSVTREEYLSSISTDLPILQTPVHLTPAERDGLKQRLGSGRPAAFFGSPAGGIDPELSRMAGIECPDELGSAVRKEATVESKAADLAKGVPANFGIYQRFTRNRAIQGASVIYSVDGSPALIRNGNILFWDPPDLEPGWSDRPIRERMGSHYPYVLVARALNLMLQDSEAPVMREIDPDRPVCMHAWRLRDGQYRILLGNTEEGISDLADQARHVEIVLPAMWTKRLSIHDLWRNQTVTSSAKVVRNLRQAESTLLALSR